MHQPFGVNPAQRSPADVELPGVIAQNHRVAEKFMRLNDAPQRPFAGNSTGFLALSAHPRHTARGCCRARCVARSGVR
jgi:hypothetical protein